MSLEMFYIDKYFNEHGDLERAEEEAQAALEYDARQGDQQAIDELRP